MKRLGYITAGIIRDLRRCRNISRLCREWPRAMGEIIDEVGAKSGRMTAIEQRLEQCVELLDAGVVEAISADARDPSRPDGELPDGSSIYGCDFDALAEEGERDYANFERWCREQGRGDV